MNALYIGGWSISVVQHTVGKDVRWFELNFNEEEKDLYERMKAHYKFWRKRTALNERLLDFFKEQNEKELH